MSKRPKLPTVRLGEFGPVVDAIKLTKGLRSGIVGGRKRTASLAPAEGGMIVSIYGSSTFVPLVAGVLDRELNLDPGFLAGFIMNAIRAFHPGELFTIEVDADQAKFLCGTLQAVLRLLPAP